METKIEGNAKIIELKRGLFVLVYNYRGFDSVLGFSDNFSTFVTKEGMTDDNGISYDTDLFKREHHWVTLMGPGLYVEDNEKENDGTPTKKISYSMAVKTGDDKLDLKTFFEDEVFITGIQHLTHNPVGFDDDMNCTQWEDLFAVSRVKGDEIGELITSIECVVIDEKGNLSSRSPKRYDKVSFDEELGFVVGKISNQIDILSRGGYIQLENLQNYSLNAKIIENGYGYGDTTSVICDAVDESGNKLLFSIFPEFGSISAMLDPQYSSIMKSIRNHFTLSITPTIGEQTNDNGAKELVKTNPNVQQTSE